MTTGTRTLNSTVVTVINMRPSCSAPLSPCRMSDSHKKLISVCIRITCLLVYLIILKRIGSCKSNAQQSNTNGKQRTVHCEFTDGINVNPFSKLSVVELETLLLYKTNQLCNQSKTVQSVAFKFSFYTLACPLNYYCPQSTHGISTSFPF